MVIRHLVAALARVLAERLAPAMPSPEPPPPTSPDRCRICQGEATAWEASDCGLMALCNPCFARSAGWKRWTDALVLSARPLCLAVRWGRA